MDYKAQITIGRYDQDKSVHCWNPKEKKQQVDEPVFPLFIHD